MKVSVITVCYNSEKFIADTLNSVIKQSYPGLEYIVVDGNSSDNTVNIIRSFGNRISQWVSEPDKGLYDAMNKGILLATGDVLGFLHSDDFFSDEKVVGRIAETFEKTGADSVFGDIRFVDMVNTGKVLTSRNAGEFRRWKMLFGWHPPHPAFYVKRELILKHGLFDTFYNISADYEMMLRLLIVNRITAAYIPEVLVKMRVGGVSNRTMENVRHKWVEDYLALRKNHFGNPLTIFLKTMRPVAHFYRNPKYLWT